jgi:hypothetical protein
MGLWWWVVVVPGIEVPRICGGPILQHLSQPALWHRRGPPVVSLLLGGSVGEGLCRSPVQYVPSAKFEILIIWSRSWHGQWNMTVSLRLRQSGQETEHGSKPGYLASHTSIHLKSKVCPHGCSISCVVNGSKQIGQFEGSSAEGNDGAVLCSAEL